MMIATEHGQVTRQRGTALVITAITITIISLLLVALFGAVNARGRVETSTSDGHQLLNGADAGLERARLMIGRHSNESAAQAKDRNWLRYWAGTIDSSAPFARNTTTSMQPIVWEDGNDYFNVGDGLSGITKVQVFILDPSPAATDASAYTDKYMVVARAEMDGISRSSAIIARPRDYFSKFARFVTKTTGTALTISADNTVYGGPVHANGNISITADNARFEGLVSSAGTISVSGQASGAEPVFEKGTAENVPKIEPSADWQNIDDIKATLPSNAVIYDCKDADFKTKMAAATGYTPQDNDVLEVKVVFDKGKMTTVTNVYSSVSYGTNWGNYKMPSYSGLKATLTEADVDTPHDAPLYVNGNAEVKGDTSSRNSLIADKVFINGPIRYVNDAGDSQYSLYENNGNVANFDNTNKEWLPSTTQKWDDPTDSTSQHYGTAENWTPPTNSGAAFNPCLGIVSVNGSWEVADRQNGSAYKNIEQHAYIMSINSVHNATDRYYNKGSYWGNSRQDNCYYLGGLATFTGCPVWDFKYSHIRYDPNLSANPPPGFPTTPEPTFKNWHEVTTGENGTAFNLSNHDIANAWK